MANDLSPRDFAPAIDGAQIGGIALALAKAQAVMGRAKKDSKNPHFKSSYADLSSVMDACIGPLSENGIAVIQPTGRDEYGEYAETVLIHGESGQSLRCRVPLIVGKNDMQGYGSAVTYARRYGLMCMAGIAPDDDDGNAAAASMQGNKHQAPQFDAKAAADRIIRKLSGSVSLDDLRSRWTEEASTIAEIKAASTDHFSEIERAKNARKMTLETAQNANADLGGDEIPY